MNSNECIQQTLGICWQAADAKQLGTVFGFAEFLTILAIFAVAYNVVDERYKFRIEISPIPLLNLLFSVSISSALTLVLVRVWFTNHLPIPRLLNNPQIYETGVASILVAVLLYWLRYAYLKPPLFSEKNAQRYLNKSFQSISGGNPQELAAAAYEIGRSATQLIREARKVERVRDFKNGGFKSENTHLSELANQVLALTGDKRFCRYVAKNVPWVAEEIFREAGNDELGNLQIVQFSRNVSSELLADPETAIHHEDEWYNSGLIGHIKPISVTVFGNSKLVEQLAAYAGSPLNPSWKHRQSWSVTSWETYNRLALLYFNDKLKRIQSNSITSADHQIFDFYEYACSDAYRINDMLDNHYNSIEYQKFIKVVDFINGILKLLEKYNIKGNKKPQLHDGHIINRDIYDELAKVAFSTILASASVDTAEFRSWEVQHNSVWRPLMQDFSNTEVRSIFRSRLQRLLWSEIRDMERYANFKGAKIIMVCLHIMGFNLSHAVNRPPETRALKRAVIGWVRKNYLQLADANPKVAEACIGGSLSFDPHKKQIIKTYNSMLGKEPNRDILDLLSPPTNAMKANNPS
ncbi:hypothetical protein [Brucella gallinifaecis]|uniref:hypothetical protein n=1 Tax=Brucella gallinifaecis TaxID=215590 RepID=UPI002360A3E7|nr:hypothetical protein [Brucella gallinifaecis]